MFLAESCTITELWDKPGLVQATGACIVCGVIIHRTMSEGTMKKILETKSFEGTSFNERDRLFLSKGVCTNCKSPSLQARNLLGTYGKGVATLLPLSDDV